MPLYYAVKTGPDRYDLRQERFRNHRPEHPHDVMMAGFKAEDMRDVCQRYGFDADLSALDDERL